MERDERIIIFFASAAHFFAHFSVLVFPALVMPMSRELGLPLSQVMDISFAMYLLYGLMALFWGFLSNRIGNKPALSSGVLLAGIGMLLAGMSSNISSSPAFLALSLALVGIGSSAFHPCGLSMVSQNVKQRGKAMGIVGVFGNIGIASVPFTIGLLNYFIGWHKGLMILGGAGCLLGLSMFISPFKVIAGEDKIEVDKLKQGHASRLFIVFCIGFIFSGLMYRSFTIILPSYLEFQLGNVTAGFRTFIDNRFGDLANTPAFNTLTANLIATCIYIIGIVGQLIGGKVADTYSLKWAYFAFFFIAAPFLIGMALFTNGFLILFSGMFVLFSLGMQPIENSLVAYLTPPQWRSVSYGIKFTLAFGVGSFAVKIVSFTESMVGIENIVWLVVLFLSMLILIISLFLILSRGTKIDHKLTT